MSRITLLDQCAKAVADVPHAVGCNATVIGDERFCTCRVAREALIAAGLRAMVRCAKRQRFANVDLEAELLETFRRAAVPPSGRQPK